MTQKTETNEHGQRRESKLVRPYLIDLGSTNGCYVNGDRIEAQRCVAVAMRARVRVRACACLCLCVWVHACACACLYMSPCVHVRVCLCLCLCLCVPVCARLYVCVPMHACLYVDEPHGPLNGATHVPTKNRGGVVWNRHTITHTHTFSGCHTTLGLAKTK